MKILKLSLMASTLLYTPAAFAGWYDNYSSMVVFGDSLHDNGNLYDEFFSAFAVNWGDYADGRFSNGPVWSDYAEQDLNAAGIEYNNNAHGGARAGLYDDFFVTDFQEQVTEETAYFTSGAAGDRPLASIGFGGNDGILIQEGASLDSIITNAVNGLKAGVEALLGLGVRDFVIWDVPDISTTPRFNHFNTGLQELAATITSGLNAAYNDVIDMFTRDHADAVFTKFEFASVVDGPFNDPEAFGFLDTDLPCLYDTAELAAEYGQDGRICDDPNARVFYDDIHPSSAAHRQIYDAFAARMTAVNAVAPVPLPASAWMLGAALGGLGVRRALRKKMA